jgi:A/G-specific adenine glycosylase
VLRPFGLVWRARKLHDCARVIVRDHGGEIPVDHEALLALPGVGTYVAAAVMTVVDDRRVVLVDTNTVRVATRVAGLYRAGDIRRRADVREAIEDLLGGAVLASDWWAVIDLSATLCRPRDPKCGECPLRGACSFGALG